MAGLISRRKFMAGTVASTVGIATTTHLAGRAYSGTEISSPAKPKREPLMEEVMRYKKIDAHAHVGGGHGTPAEVADFAERLGIHKVMISKPMAPGSAGVPSEFRACNDVIYSAMKEFPNRFTGMLTLNPTHKQESMDEIKRCIDRGFVGMKLYNHVKINDPLFYPIIEKFIDLKMIILMHSPIGKARVKYNAREPKNISIPEDFVDAAKRFPEAMFQFAHIGGGIDWEDACKALKDSPNVYVDVSGSNNEGNMIDFALRYIGEDRLLFGCDNGFYQGVGGMIAANLTEVQRKKIFFENYNNILKKSGRNVD
ncbi:amidohydrolase family protein [Dyadobacter sp. CY323]|uniref:amidohydrolase family protein n=1 Tax=Dyadobacter sp. CY323 TaxID=2907302 RepID=UPI001F1C7921|nr:amidohydrolase family protein [Dyadobacter sp. CY323]MCE6992488.1 amidohydrolase family protein [Dyadobacter sp. CY323]